MGCDLRPLLNFLIFREMVLWTMCPEEMRKMADDRDFLHEQFPTIALYYECPLVIYV
jgi:hypothetical protein